MFEEVAKVAIGVGGGMWGWEGWGSTNGSFAEMTATMSTPLFLKSS